jgi:hypothetical protein
MTSETECLTKVQAFQQMPYDDLYNSSLLR